MTSAHAKPITGGYPSTRLVHPVRRRDVGGAGERNHFWRRRGAPPWWSLSLIAAAAQAYPTPAQEQQVHIYAHCPVEHIPEAITIVVDIAIIDPPCCSLPPLYDNAGTIVVLPPYGPPRKLTLGQSQPSIDPAPPEHPWRVLFDIRAITDPARLRNAPVKEGDYKRQCSRVTKRSPPAPIPIISHGMGAVRAYADVSLATSDLIRACHDDGCCFSHSCTRKCHRGKSLL